MTDIRRITAQNRAAWDASAVHHGTGTYWDDLCTGFTDPTYSRFDATTQCLVDTGSEDI